MQYFRQSSLLSDEQCYRADETLCLFRWLDTGEIVAKVEKRNLTHEEKAGPFDVFRWSTQTGSYMRGHPRAGSPHYGVVAVSQVRSRAPIFAGVAEPANAANPLFRLITDMLRRF